MKSYSNESLFLIWIWASFILSILFNNEILSKLIFKKKLIIGSIDELNNSEFTALVWPSIYKKINTHVSNYNFLQLLLII